MSDKTTSCILISDFTIETLARVLSNDDTPPRIRAASAPFDQVRHVLIDARHPCWRERPDFAIVWTRPESAVPAFSRLLIGQSVQTEALLSEVDEFAELVVRASERVDFVLVPTWVAPLAHRGLGLLDLKSPLGIAGSLLRMNLRLIDALSSGKRVFPLDSSRWLTGAGGDVGSAKLWYLAKTIFDVPVLAEAIKDIKAAVNGMHGSGKKLVIVDLDDTLWGDIVGDVGWENIRLGGHDAIGEAFVDFQRALLALKNRGVLLGIVSKNDEDTALAAISRHPEMVLRQSDFGGWKINWHDKAQNVAELVDELNLGLQSVVFIDDNPVERARIKDALPEVLVPDWPQDKTLYAITLRAMTCFDSPSISTEDLGRTAMYAEEQKRAALKKRVGSVDEWLQSLSIVATIEPPNDVNRERTVQLLNKTNQMNLSTRRLTDGEFGRWVANEHHYLWTVRVKDKFGDSGLTGIVSMEVHGDRARIVDFVLSCRVMGRKIEETMLHVVCANAKALGASEVFAVFKATPKNKPCFEFWQRSGFSYDAQSTFSWSLADTYAAPDCVHLDVADPHWASTSDAHAAASRGRSLRSQ